MPQAVRVAAFLASMAGVASGFSVPHLFWRQRDIQASTLNDSISEHRLLVASRASPFKDSLVAGLRRYFDSQPVFVRFVGLKQLVGESAGSYNAIVLINTCMSWDMDRHVVRFLRRNRDVHNRIIVVTTSGSGRWEPRRRGRAYDAVTAASEADRVGRTVETVTAKVEAVLQRARERESVGPAATGKE